MHRLVALVGVKGLHVPVPHRSGLWLSPAHFLTQPEVKGVEQRSPSARRSARVRERRWPRGGLQVPTPEPLPGILLVLWAELVTKTFHGADASD